MALFAIAIPIPANKVDQFQRFSKDPFSEWFKQQVMEIHGMDLSAPPPGPLPKLIVDSGAL